MSRSYVGPNAPRLFEVLTFVTNHPKAHDQGVFLELLADDSERTGAGPLLVRSDPRLASLEPFVELKCSTTACLAGWTAVIHGYEPRLTDTSRELLRGSHGYTTDEVVPTDSATPVPELRTHDDEGRPRTSSFTYVATLAACLLGLDNYQAELMFESDNTLYDLWLIANVLTLGKLTIPPHVSAENSAVLGTFVTKLELAQHLLLMGSLRDTPPEVTHYLERLEREQDLRDNSPAVT